MAQLTVAEAQVKKASGEQYISRVWLSNTVAPMATVELNGETLEAKVFRIVSHDTRRHALLYIEDFDPNTVL